MNRLRHTYLVPTLSIIIFMIATCGCSKKQEPTDAIENASHSDIDASDKNADDKEGTPAKVETSENLPVAAA